MVKKLLYFSLFLNAALLASIYLMLGRLGGWRYALHRFRQDQAGLYAHRAQLFERLPPRRNAIIFLGDSHMEQCEWRELFQADSLTLLNRGISGDQTFGLLKRLGETLRHQPRAIFLEIGINDILLSVPSDETERRYREIVSQIRSKSPQSELYLCSVPPVNNSVKRIGIENGKIQALNQKIIQIAREYALPYLDLYTVLCNPEGNLNASYTDDGIHLNGEGYLVLKSGMVKAAPYLQK